MNLVEAKSTVLSSLNLVELAETAFFGMAEATVASVEAIWPSGHSANES